MATDHAVLPDYRKPFSAVAPLVALALIAVFLLFKCTGGDPPKQNAAAQAGAGGAPAVSIEPTSQTSDAGPPPKDLPLAPPPADACVGPWCGKQISYASIIVDEGRRGTDLPKRAWVIAVATAMQESTLWNQANEKHPDSKQFAYDKKGDDADSLGLFQQRPDMGWGTPQELMQPRIAARKFYGALKFHTKSWQDWEGARLTDVAQKVQKSGYPEEYQKHEAQATQIVDLVLQHVYKGDNGDSATRNPWLVMFQCKEIKSRDCRAVPWHLANPVVTNRDAFTAAYPKAAAAHGYGDLGNGPHQKESPQDHTSGAPCLADTPKPCNVPGWVYAQDFGNGSAPDAGFDLNRFVRWLMGAVRAGRYQEVKYVISTIPSNKGTKYYGSMSFRNNWEPTGKNRTDHAKHVHVSYKPGYERAESRIIADFLDYTKTGGAKDNKLAAAPAGVAAGFRPTRLIFFIEYHAEWRPFTPLP